MSFTYLTDFFISRLVIRILFATKVIQGYYALVCRNPC